MHINEARSEILSFLKQQGYTVFTPRGPIADFRITPAPTDQITIASISPTFDMVISDISESIAKKLNCHFLTLSKTKVAFRNKDWEIAQRTRKLKNKNNQTQNSGSLETKEEVATSGETKKVEPLEHLDQKEMFRHLQNFGSLIDRMEDVIDSYTLKKAAWSETLGKLYDALSEKHCRVYNADVPIQITSSSGVTMPDITKDAFIKIALSCMHKSP